MVTAVGSGAEDLKLEKR
ncbi:hypothetical protein WG8_1154 [Paenibacillus sp. Aloe-11]|nr:hypothetical protein WG8_1154 [Paenibacillus sp. Aloe-11]